MSTISILFNGNEERVICSFSDYPVVVRQINVVGEGYMGVTQSYNSPDNQDEVVKYIKENRDIEGYSDKHYDHRQYGFFIDGEPYVHHGKSISRYYGHHHQGNIMVIANRVKNKEILQTLFNNLIKGEGDIKTIISNALYESHVVGFDWGAEKYGLSSTSISYSSYDENGKEMEFINFMSRERDPMKFMSYILKFS